MKKLTKTEKLLLSAVAFLTMIVVLLTFRIFTKEEIAILSSISTPQASPVIKNTDSISIPGYDGFELKSGVCEQSLALGNPVENTCHMVMTLTLHDGTLLWESEELMPGMTTKVTLFQPLAQGNYPDCTLTYTCSTPEGKPLNGASTKLTLRVI